MTATVKAHPTVACVDCGRQTGILPGGRALPYELDDRGRRHCANRPKCKLARLGPGADKIDHPTTK